MWMKPSSSSPMMSSSVTRTSSKNELGGVGLVLADLVELAAAARSPAVPVSTPKSVMPRAFFSGAVRAATTTRSAE